MIKLIAGDFTLDAAAGDMPRRTISGTAVPYNVEAVVSDGTSVIFRPGSLPVEGKAPRLFMYHDASQPVGIVTERVDTDQGMMFSAKISATSLGNDALVMAADGTIDPSHIEFKFVGKDIFGFSMNTAFDQFTGFSGAA